MVRIGKDPPDWGVTIRGGILAYMYLYCTVLRTLINLSFIWPYSLTHTLYIGPMDRLMETMPIKRIPCLIDLT